MPKTLIIGAGLAGMSCARSLKTGYEILEKNAHAGGLVVTDERDGFRFDLTGHWLHMRDPGIKRWIGGLLGDRMTVVERKARIFSKGVVTHYPFQTNTYGLPLPVVQEIIREFVEDTLVHPPRKNPRTFEEWVMKHMGRGIARHFMIPYNEKLWRTHPRDMTPYWCQHYVPKPTLDQIVEGAVAAPDRKIGYNATFSYPLEGGIGELSRAIVGQLDASRIRYSTWPVQIHAKTRKVTLNDGNVVEYQRLVNSAPLPELVRLIADAPPSVRAAAEKLVHNGVFYYNIALKRPPLSDAHWIYFPEKEFPFYRVGSFSNAVPSMAPEGKGNLYVEFSYRGNMNRRDLWRQTSKALVQGGVIASEDDVLFVDPKEIPCAYVVFDSSYERSLKTIFGWLKKMDIHSIGRYGRWTYNSMESALIEGRDTAKSILEAQKEDA